MEECELCGRQTKDVYVLNVENVEIRACAACAKGKKVVRTELEKKQAKKPAFVRPKSEEEMELVENYGNVIKNARENMKIPITVLAEMLNEKEHYLVRVEEQKTKPTMALTKKLEKALNIKLTEAETGTGAGPQAKQYTKKASDEPTIGDFIGG